jgi:Domain of unknown function (DUF4279)
MRISQRVYLDVTSETVTADAVTAFLGMEPDHLLVRGAKRDDPPVPFRHSWSIHCRDRGLKIDAQIEKILARIEPIRSRFAAITSHQDVSIRLVIVRHFDDEEGEEESLDAAVTKDGKLLERLPGQHQLLGWYLPVEHLELLAQIRCAIWADEYG